MVMALLGATCKADSASIVSGAVTPALMSFGGILWGTL